MELVAIPDMIVVEKDLRNSPAAVRFGAHLAARLRVAIHRDLGKSELLAAQQLLRAAAIGAGRRRVNRNVRHRAHLSQNVYMGSRPNPQQAATPHPADKAEQKSVSFRRRRKSWRRQWRRQPSLLHVETGRIYRFACLCGFFAVALAAETADLAAFAAGFAAFLA